MNKIVFFVTVTKRSMREEFISFLKAENAPIILSTLGIGTAGSDILDYLGLGETEKEILFSVMTREKSKSVLKAMKKNLYIDMAGNGIVFTVPLSSVGRADTLKLITGSSEICKEEEIKAMENYKYDLIITIASRGYAEDVMAAARLANATGGTVIHANGIGMEAAEKFFGISIAEDKDMIFIVCDSASKNNIMKSIVTNAGIQTKAKSIVFSLPVCDIEGLRIIEED